MKIEILVNDIDDGITDCLEAIACAGARLLEKSYIQSEYIQACIDREKNYPTGLQMGNGEGIAIPHADYQLVKTDSISIVRFPKGIVFGQMEDAELKVECKILFNLAFSTSDQHLSILRRLFTLFQENSFIENCLALNNEQIREYVEKQLASK